MSAETSTALTPEYVTIADGCRLFGLSRSAVYREAGAGRLRILKRGRRSVLAIAELRANAMALPTATVRPSK